MKLCSCIVPCYNEESAVPFYYREMQGIMEQLKTELEFELIFVDDGSSDGTLKAVQSLAKTDKRVRYLSFSRNFGKEAALYAGLEKSRGDYVVTMDADLQDPPSLMPQMYEELKSGEYDCIATRRVSRKGEPPIRSFFAKKFYRLMKKISNADIMDGARDYRFMSRQMTEAILSMKEYNRFSKGIFGWVGFRTKWLSYENVERVAGETKWSFWKLFVYSLEGIVAFSTTPLMIASVAGVVFCVIAFIMLLIIFIRALAFGDPVDGWPSMVCIISFLGGIQLFCIGVTGMYLAKTYLEVKKRPIYLVKEENEELE